MVTNESMDLYRKQYPKDHCFYAEETGNIMIELPDGTSFIPRENKDEEDSVFLDRLERSKQAGRNLFYEEWELFEEEEGVIY